MLSENFGFIENFAMLLCRLFRAYDLQLTNIQFPSEGCLVDYVSAVKRDLSRLVCFDF